MDMNNGKFNFEDLKKEWNDQASTVEIPQDLNRIKAAQTPIDKIRKNIKFETIVMVIAILFLAFVPFLSVYNISGISELIYYIVLFLMIVSAIPYYKNFYSYYKKTGHIQFNTYRSISAIYYELKNTIRLYKTINYILIPYSLILFFIVLSKGRSETIFQIIMDLPNSFVWENYGYFLALALVVLFTLLSILFIGFWVNQFYGKPILELEKILDQFEEEHE
jgi:hypothetical protein